MVSGDYEWHCIGPIQSFFIPALDLSHSLNIYISFRMNFNVFFLNFTNLNKSQVFWFVAKDWKAHKVASSWALTCVIAYAGSCIVLICIWAFSSNW